MKVHEQNADTDSLAGRQASPLGIHLSKFLLSVGLILACSHSAIVIASDIDTANDIGAATVQLIDGSEFEATITSIDQDGNVSGEGVPNGLNLREILKLNTARAAAPNASNKVSIMMVGGGKLMVRQPKVAGEKVTFKSNSGVEELTLQAVRAIVWKSSPMVTATLQDPSKEYDTVIVQTNDGDRSVGGILESIDHEFVRINYKGESRKIGLGKLKAVITADLGIDLPTGSRATIDLTDQSRIVGLIENLTNGHLQIALPSGTPVKINTSNIVRFSIASDRLLYLSDIDPVDVQEKAIFAVQLRWQRDRSAGDNQIQIRLPGSEKTVTFNKGLGTQSSSRLVFANANGFDRFAATAGIDAETDGRGDCQMVVRGDGIELWSKRVRGMDGPQEIDVDITGMKEIALIVYPGEEFDLGDHADWAAARFLKTK